MRRKITALALATLAAFAAAGSAQARMPSPEKVFKAWDKNADGSIDKDEWIAAGRKEKRFTQADTDGDGKVSLEELRAGMARMKTHPAAPTTGEQTPPAEH
ncbi:EF-hand domain-containing protein [Caulobacter sp. LjRoot300]|uniref:EF-hand domain-containing protein n=1 Tax=Caulobacter sp. LjRoot300 TaxID=3342321 RepID=UPI003ECEDA90